VYHKCDVQVSLIESDGELEQPPFWNRVDFQ